MFTEKLCIENYNVYVQTRQRCPIEAYVILHKAMADLIKKPLYFRLTDELRRATFD